MVKKVLLALSIFAGIELFAACSSAGNEKAEAGTTKTEVSENSSIAEQVPENPGEPMYLDKELFLNRVMNYEKNPEVWKYEGDKPALIDFYADWCGPCRQAAPVLDELAKDYKGEIYIYKIDTEKQKELAAAFGIQSIPAFLWVPMEGKPTMSSGIARSQEETKKMFEDMINDLLLKNK